MKKRVFVLLNIFLVISGCNVHTMPTAFAADGVVVSKMMQNSVAHSLNFNVRPGVQARVTLAESGIRVQTNNRPAVRVRALNLPLLREWERVYLLVNDFDRDGINDLAVLNTAGRVGQKRCYAVYRYNPATGSFRDRKSFDRCFL